jgi:hypothetical protein
MRLVDLNDDLIFSVITERVFNQTKLVSNIRREIEDRVLDQILREVLYRVNKHFWDQNGAWNLVWDLIPNLVMG